ncbi:MULTISPECIES: GNAT family N-acetyltransferase [unclassified Leifsonia]|uniref:GNAT family N-acetyltransferase n=1 Tax=unclassified Leifsonia TaxID=2663824 RepID=UPI0006FCB32D|nr:MULTISPECIES: GNAT family protein [unclassified Leifsonia]KQX04948.1 acetyltransferase [Leifsonia sp. Root1293]KRA08580.1 acetyltransferase [Leifsonia sp. Root60]
MTAVLPPFEPLVGRFIAIEPLTRAHLPELYDALAHPEVFAGGFGGGPAGFRADRVGFLAWAEQGYRFDSELAQPYAIRLVGGHDDGRLVGSSTLADFDLPLESTHIGWTAYDPRVWGTAVNPETKLLLLGRAFDSGFGRVKIQADALNDRSRAAILKLGAQFEGIVRRERPRADGSWRDTAVYSILVDEWPAVRAGLLARLEAGSGDPVVLRPYSAR